MPIAFWLYFFADSDSEMVYNNLPSMIEQIQRCFHFGHYRFTLHALERCLERDISPEKIHQVVISGTVIEDYPKDKYGPTCLIAGKTKEGQVLHVQCSIEPVWVITAYDPALQPTEWEAGYLKRKE
jgi:hypothetical protein